MGDVPCRNCIEPVFSDSSGSGSAYEEQLAKVCVLRGRWLLGEGGFWVS